MSDIVQAPFVLHNLHGGGERDFGVRYRIIKKFLDASRGGMGSFNELHPKDRKHLRKQAKERGLKVFIHGKNGAVWDPNLITVRKKRIKKISQGGFVGADEVATARRGDDDRRVGPNRYAIYLDCVIPEFSLPFEWVITHLMAKTFTSYTWRNPIWRRSVKRLSDAIRRDDGVLTGDMNSPDYVKLPGVHEVAELTPPTHGSRRYDQIVRWGQHVDFVKVKDVNTPSDHDMLVSIIKFFRTPRKR